MSAVCDCSFNIFAATFHIGGRYTLHNLRTCHTMVTVTRLSQDKDYKKNIKKFIFKHIVLFPKKRANKHTLCLVFSDLTRQKGRRQKWTIPIFLSTLGHLSNRLSEITFFSQFTGIFSTPVHNAHTICKLFYSKYTSNKAKRNPTDAFVIHLQRYITTHTVQNYLFCSLQNSYRLM
jgi:hypothetical protein